MKNQIIVPFASFLILAAASVCRGDSFTLAATGFNQDIIAENTATAPNQAVTGNVGGVVLYEAGAPNTTGGLPANGLVTSLTTGIQYQLGAYNALNALVLRGNSKTLTLSDPQSMTQLDVLGFSGMQYGDDMDVQLNFADGTSYTGVVFIPAVYDGGFSPAIQTGVEADGSSWTAPYYPTGNLFDITLVLPTEDQSETVNSITFIDTDIYAPDAILGLAEGAPTPPTPEPGTLLLLGSGLLAAGRFTRRKVAAQAKN